MDSGAFVTKWDLSLATETRIAAVVASALPGASLQAVWAPTREAILGGTWELFGAPIACDAAGFVASAWTALPPEAKADVFVGFVLLAGVEVAELSFGIAEVQVR